MKVFQINSIYRKGSTVRIAADLKQVMEASGISGFVAYGIGENIGEDHVFLLQSKNEMRISQVQSRLFARHGFNNVSATKRLFNHLDEIKPDIVHLHNIHGYYIHCGLLFEYIKENHIPVVWTLHDCWSFTGWCAYFDYSGCDKWKTFCHHCPSKKDYPRAWFSPRAKSNFRKKKMYFCGLENLTLVTPSYWLAQLTRESFLKDYPVIVINNGVDVNIFKPVKNNLKKELGIEGKKVILAVAGGLAIRKGRDYLLKIPSLLNQGEILVILGIRNDQIKILPQEKCIGKPYTNSVNELAAIYSAADDYVNTTLEDNFPTTNLEAMACGTPVVTFDTGGSVEPVLDKEDILNYGTAKNTSVGSVVPKGDMNTLIFAIRQYLSMDKKVISENCVKKAHLLFNKNKQYELYVKLYKELSSH